MNPYESNINAEELRVAVRLAFRKVVPNPTFETTWWKNLFGDTNEANTETNIEMSVREHKTNAAA